MNLQTMNYHSKWRQISHGDKPFPEPTYVKWSNQTEHWPELRRQTSSFRIDWDSDTALFTQSCTVSPSLSTLPNGLTFHQPTSENIPTVYRKVARVFYLFLFGKRLSQRKRMKKAAIKWKSGWGVGEGWGAKIVCWSNKVGAWDPNIHPFAHFSPCM